MRAITLYGTIAVLVLSGLCATPGFGQAEPDEEGWISLFNGEDLDGWHMRHEGGRNGWTAEDGVLVNTAPSTDIVSELKFADHELHVEFRVPKDGNSGVYLQGRYEIQVHDSEGMEPEAHMCGSLYGLTAPLENACKPAGEWQSFDVKFVAPTKDDDDNVVNGRITVKQNDVLIIDDFEIVGLTGGALDDQILEPGPLMLQGDHSSVDYRNIKYRPLEGE